MSAWRTAERAVREALKPIGPLTLKTAAGAARLRVRGLAALRCVWPARRRPAAAGSLSLRLSVFFAVFLVTAWLFTAFFAWMECRAYINEFFDTQQMLFAKRLAGTDFTGHDALELQTQKKPPGLDKRARGDLEDDALGFAVFTSAGELVMADAQNGRHFTFEPDRKGFSDRRLPGREGALWRIVRLASGDGRHIVAVGQEVEYRRDMALEMLSGQLMPWLALFPILLLGLIILLRRELAPLRALTKQLQARVPEDATPINVDRIPAEVRPMAEALNGFLAKTNAMVARERSFISDAAHELRTPLAGLRIQTQVAAQGGLADAAREEAFGFLLRGIDRCSRLVEQLLALSRLDAMGESAGQEGAPPAGLAREAVNWAALLDESMREYRPKAAMKGQTLEYAPASPGAATPGYPPLLSMLLRNLLDNAVRYAPRNGHIGIFLDDNRLIIENTASTFPQTYAGRLGERFFRPPGQEEPGSGLGLSIVRRIAAIHRFGLAVRIPEEKPDAAEARFRVTLTFAGGPE